MASHSIKLQNYREYRMLLIALPLTLVNSATKLLHCNNFTGCLSWSEFNSRCCFLLSRLFTVSIAPYSSELITVKPKSTYSLHSNNSTLLLPPTMKMLPTLGAHSFAAAVPALWNKLLADDRNVASLNSFKKDLYFSNEFYCLLFFHSILYLILYKIFVKPFWSHLERAL